MNHVKNICIISLGCSKNLVDAEGMLFALQSAGYVLVNEPENADCVIINTCSFIEAAQQEAVDTILETAALKKMGRLKGLIVTGCMAQMFKEQVIKEIPEVDSVLGTGSYGKIVKAVQSVLDDTEFIHFGDINEGILHNKDRILSTPFYSAYIKISEGCDNRCAYCAIPSLRGKFRSRSIEDIVKEAVSLANRGVKELIVIAQDTSRYGLDLYGEYSLHKLLPLLCKIDGIEWIRLHYLYPDKITDELLLCIAQNDKILNYFDIPIQHASDKILTLMNRIGNKAYLRKLFKKIRTVIPDAVLRTSIMVGFPGETDEDFNILCEFVKDIRFDRLGVFVFSPQEGTPAFEMQNQVSKDIANRRQQLLMELQSGISLKQNESKVGKALTVLYEGTDENGMNFGRSYGDSPDIDGNVYFPSDKKHKEGEFVSVLIKKADMYELYGTEITDI